MDIRDVRVAAPAVQLAGVGVDRHYVVLAAPEFLKQAAREILRVPGNADYRQAFGAQKLVDLGERRHGLSSI
jgi:hypothetical protein